MDESNLEQFPVSVSVATPNDASAIAHIKHDSRPYLGDSGQGDLESSGMAEESVTDLAESIARMDEDDRYLVAKRQGKVVGACRITWKQEDHRFTISHFYVKPEDMKKVGIMLFSAAKEHIERSSHDVKGISVFVEGSNEIARNMYRHWGFKEGKKNEEDHWTEMILNF